MTDPGNTTTPDYQRWLDSQPPYYADEEEPCTEPPSSESASKG